jgi:hypothetical protein
MPDDPKTHATAVANHGRDLRKVTEQLRELVASLRSDNERFASESRQVRERAPDPAPAPAGEDPRAAAVERLSAELALAHEALALSNAERERLRAQLAEIAAENRRICDDYVAVQEHGTELAGLFVMLERLHGGVSRAELLTALQEIVINVVGSEELAVFERRRDRLHLVHSFGVEAEPLGEIPLGQGAIGRAAAEGRLYVANRAGAPQPGDERVTAVIPLRLGDEIGGAIAIFRLLGHKPGLDERDEALFGLLSTHVGVALHLRGADEPLGPR